MSREKFDYEKEHDVVGYYPPVKGAEWFSAEGLPPTPRYYRPIEARDNFKMMFQGKTPYWIPDCGPVSEDITCFRPRQHPDNLANHQCFDGGDRVDYESIGDVITGWFGIRYKFEPQSSGMMPMPGEIKIPDINKWESYVTFPNLDDMDWDAIGEMNREYLGTDRVNQLGIQLGFWERLMSAMGVMEGAIALIDDEQKEGVHRFFDYLATLYQDYITRLSKVCRLDSVVIHDDWGHQASSFFSLDTCLEMIVPHLKRVVGTIHDLGMLYEHHSCGKASSMVPAMIEAGVDWWMPQPALNDLDDLVETYIDSPITFAVSCPKLSPSLKEEQIKEMAQLWVSKYKDKGVILAPNMIFASDNDISKYPCFKDAVYTYSRIAYQDCE